MNKAPEISIVLPVYNEGENISKQIDELEKTIKYKHEILIVYDFDEDTTVPFVRKLQKQYKQSLRSSSSRDSTAGLKNLRLIKNVFGRGVINAVKSGFAKSRGDVLVVMPADLADEPSTINKMYEKLSRGFDIVCATRYAKGGKKIGGEFLKTTLSRIAGLMTPILLGIPTSDIANGFKMYRRRVVESIKIESTGGWEYSCELIIKAHHLGFKVSEIPTVWRDRTSGKSKFKLLKWLPKYVRWYLWGIFLRLNVYRLIL